MNDDNKLWRSQTYALLAQLLASPPQQGLVDSLAAIEVDEPNSPMGEQWSQLIDQAAKADINKIHEHYQLLFIGVTHGELIPYSSYYQTGFLMEEPLAELRTDLAKLGLERQQNTSEPEDHIAAQCDVMRMILTAEGTAIVTDVQFFQRHIQPWAENFFTDLSQIDHAGFYRVVGQFAAKFIRLETALYR